MTKEEAIEAMKEGKKVTHQYFTEEEWMSIENGKVVLEDGVRCDCNEFWSIRIGEGWKDGYAIKQ